MNQNNEQKNIGLVVLIVFTLYSVNTIYNLFIDSVMVVIPILGLLSLLVMWFINLKQYLSWKVRTMINTVIIMLNCMVGIIHTSSEINLFSPFFVLTVLVGLYGAIECMYITYSFSIISLILYKVIGEYRPEYYLDSTIIHHTLINLSILHFCLISWIRGRIRSQNNSIKAIQALKKAEQIKNDFLVNVSHEIRTPLNTISGMSELIISEKDLELMRSKGKNIQLATRNLMSTVSDILDFTELQSGNVTMEVEQYEITTTINDVINMYYAKSENKKIEFIVNLDFEMPRVLEGDEKKIRRIIMNLLTNAIKFTEEGCICLIIGGRKESYGWNLTISVKDTGIGITEKDINTIFNSYGQLDTGRSRSAEGIGLGLAITKALVEKMGGNIVVRSEYGKGSTFQVVIPQKIVDESPAVLLADRNLLNVIIYINMERINLVEVRDAYQSNLRSMAVQSRINNQTCRSLNEFKRRYESKEFTHILISIDEYLEDREYFNSLAKEKELLIITSMEQEKEITAKRVHKIYKPFYAKPVIEALNKISSPEANGSGKGFTAPDAHILVVDDNQMNLTVIEGLLNRYEIKTTTAISGDEALKLVEGMNFDFIFMDHMMPEKDGIQTLNEIRAKRGVYYQNVPIIALTANSVAGARDMFLQAGFADYVEKPIEISVLERVIRRNLPESKIKEGGIEENISKTIETTDTSAIEKQPEKIRTPQPETNSGIGDLDMDSAIMYCGNEASLIKILEMFCKNAESTRSKLIEPFEAKDWKNYKIQVHALKSSMKSVGANKLSEMAKELEALAGEENETEILIKHEPMLVEYDRVVKMVIDSGKVEIPAPPPKKNKNLYPISNEEFTELAEEFKEAAFELDDQRMEEIYKELIDREYLGKALFEELEPIEVKLSHLDLFSAAELLSGIKKRLDEGRDA